MDRISSYCIYFTWFAAGVYVGNFVCFWFFKKQVEKIKDDYAEAKKTAYDIIADQDRHIEILKRIKP